MKPTKRDDLFKNLEKIWVYKWLIFLFVFSLIPVVATSKYQVHLANEILIMSLFAVSFNLLFGYTGMLSFGQAAFYGIGAYSIGILMTKTSCPYWIAMLTGIPLSAAFASILGPLCIRLKGVFFTMLTLAFGQLLWGVAFKWYRFTGGDNGIQGISLPSFFMSAYNYYYFSLIVVFTSLYICSRIVGSPFGCIIKCIRQNSERTEFIGIRIKRYQLIIYIISASFTGIAGSLFAGYEHSIHPNLMHWTKSGEIILMTIAGGFSSFFGPVIGAALILIIEDMIGARTQFWEICIGTVMLLIVLLFPDGIAGSAYTNLISIGRKFGVGSLNGKHLRNQRP